MSTGTTVQITMPQMGDSVTEGTVLEWLKGVGEWVAQDEPVLEISTDKVDTEVPAPASGKIAHIHVQPDETVSVGTVLCELETDATTHEGPNGSGPPVETSGETSADSGSETGAEPVDILLPQMGDSVSEGTVLSWLKNEGDSVAQDEPVLEISTDKVDTEVPAPVGGTLVEILVQADETVSVGTVLARILPGAIQSSKPESSAPAEAPQTPAATQDTALNATPVAQRMAKAHGVALDSIAGTGPRGRITKQDVVAAQSGDGVPSGGEQKPPAQPEATTKPLRGPASMLARAMNESLSVPTATSFRTFSVSVLDEKRRALKESGKRLSFTHIIAWAIVEAVGEMPVMAHSYTDADGAPKRVEPHDLGLGLAVDVERRDGTRALVVPVLHAADKLDLAGFIERYDELVAGARDNTLAPEAYQGANISLTNPGGIGTVASVPRLMPGQGTIVATGSIGYPAGFEQVAPDKLAELGVSKVMTMTSTYDHRVIQGAESGAFLRRIEQLLQGADGFYDRIFSALAPTGEPAAEAPSQKPAEAVSESAKPAKPTTELLQAVQAATALVKAFRMHGHLAARLDPLGSEPVGDPALEPETVNLTPELMEAIPAEVLRVAVPGETFADAFPRLQETYCQTIAYEVEHISDHRQRVWLRETIESGGHRKSLDAQSRKNLLDRLTKVEVFETYLHKAFLGRKQFSIEGVDMLVPMLDEAIEIASSDGAREVVVGMAHRGRLNVLAHTVGRSYQAILVEFEGEQNLEAETAMPEGGTGDVKYHHGAGGTYKTESGKSIAVTLASNPSHLEHVNPVVEGMARADQTSRRARDAYHDPSLVLPVLIHGDAALPGEGIAAEALNLQALNGYSTGGTVHIITNNQLGFTTDPFEGRSTRYASDLAKGFDIPIIHVNADDVEACIAAVRLAMGFRDKFGRDALIDLIGYRRYGHNETDEPSYTQPLMYERIKRQPSVRNLYATELVAQGIVSDAEADDLVNQARQELADAHSALNESLGQGTEDGEPELDRTPSREPKTAVSEDALRSLNDQLLKLPENFNVNRKLRSQLDRRRESLEEDGGIDWAHAEALAWASLLNQGVPVRLTGQDTVRGTFSQRHLVFHDAKTGETLCPIQQLAGAEAPFELHNSPLSENACLAFEYGYSTEAPEAFVLWEAQFGDFVNAAEVIVDQFIASGLAKWGQTSRLTLLLPHGYEGSGPEHSSARLERFLQLAAEGNIRVANPTTPAQYFHLLRRQALINKLRPLVVLTPKSLLRLPAARSSLSELAEGEIKRVIDDPTLPGDRESVKRLVLCSGKVYYDITTHEARAEAHHVAVARLELLYPFASSELYELISSYPSLETVVWAQEEPRNMGAYGYVAQRANEFMPDTMSLEYVGRPLRASSGEGYPAAHRAEQSRIVREALDVSESYVRAGTPTATTEDQRS
jgi:multifunctional 2-oxoglutarate metabolism enzyme